ncbi:MAG: hypothetical protein HFF86_07035 [Oscillibacter sp.]|nr:hypothetical protein [Oscillibacter sp.]
MEVKSNEKGFDRRISLSAWKYLGVDDPAGSVESPGFGMVLVSGKTFNFRVKIESDIYVWDIRFLCISGRGADAGRMLQERKQVNPWAGGSSLRRTARLHRPRKKWKVRSPTPWEEKGLLFGEEDAIMKMDFLKNG